MLPITARPLRIVLLSVLLLGTADAWAFAQASRNPATPAGDDETVSVGDGSIIDLNPGRVPVTSTAGFESVTSIFIDSTMGIVKGYASYSLDADQTYATIDDAGGSGVGGIFSLDTFLMGPASSDPVDIVVEMAFDGSFVITDGSPTLFLGADLVATTSDGGFPLPTGNIYQSALTFSTPAVADPTADVDITFAGAQSPLLGGPTMDFEGASAEVISSALGDLRAILRMTIPVSLGDTLALTGVILGGAGPSPDPADSDLSDGIDVLAAAGATEFSDTAEFRILLPDGYSLGGGDPLLDGIVGTTAIPIPATLWLLAGSLLACGRFTRRALGVR